LVLLVILVLGAYLRFHSLATNPPALSQDEVVNGYDAYSLGHTLRDHHGKFLPLTFGSFGDSASVALTYLTVPFVVIGGLSEFTVRLPIALTGIGSILLMYLFLKELRSNKKLALLGAFITAIVPWNITLTRWAVPPCIVPFFCLLFLWLFVKSFGAKNSKSRLGWLAATGLAAALLTYSYPSAEIITPLLVLAAGLTYYYKRWADLLSLYISYGLAVLPLFYLIIFEPASNFARFNAVHISGTPAQIIRQVATNYAGYFVPSFYFGAKGKNPIMHMPGAGNFYAFFGILALAAAALFTIRLIRSGKPLVKLGHYLKNPPVL
jgi:4-amino-4-deoxy-L-arabinose transferase-like glycosyltransferase